MNDILSTVLENFIAVGQFRRTLALLLSPLMNGSLPL